MVDFRDVADPLAKLGGMLEGFDLEELKRVGLRMHELRPGQSARFQFQVRTGEETAELQVMIERIGKENSRLSFRSSEQVIRLVREAFG